jgi:hypothetical protein
MTTAENELATALRERRQIIADEDSRKAPAEHMKRLQEISSRIEFLCDALPRPIAPRLAHYLDRRSYDKALDLLEATARDD